MNKQEKAKLLLADAVLRVKHDKRYKGIDQVLKADVKKRKKKTRPKKKLSADEIISGLFKGAEKATGKDFSLDVIQHVTDPDECRLLLQRIKATFTKIDGTLDREGYCGALNRSRDNILFTIDELKKAIEDTRREGNEKPIPGYETLIEKYETNAGIIKTEIEKNGGKAN